MTSVYEFKKILEKAGFQNVRIESIGKNVWQGFDKWISQGEFKGTWDENWYKSYQENLVDYFVVTAEKPLAANVN